MCACQGGDNLGCSPLACVGQREPQIPPGNGILGWICIEEDVTDRNPFAEQGDRACDMIRIGVREYEIVYVGDMSLSE